MAGRQVRVRSIGPNSVFFRHDTFICSRLAPYTGWDDFFARTVRAWEVWRKSAGHTVLSRIGVRYVNRIDVPVANTALVRPEDVLNVFPKSPEDLGAPLSAYAMEAIGRSMWMIACWR